MDKNRKTLLIIMAVVVGMTALAFASVPLYSLFCQVTGYAGTTQVSTEFPEEASENKIKVYFDARTSPRLNWEFEPEVRRMTVKIGDKGMMNYIAKNRSGQPIGGTAIYNVTPAKAGQYFHKVECFCFQEQVLGPRAKVNMPLLFFIDPSIEDDPNMAEVKEITLSYTFYPLRSDEYERAMKEYIDRPEEEISPMGAVDSTDLKSSGQ